MVVVVVEGRAPPWLGWPLLGLVAPAVSVPGGFALTSAEFRRPHPILALGSERSALGLALALALGAWNGKDQTGPGWWMRG